MRIVLVVFRCEIFFTEGKKKGERITIFKKKKSIIVFINAFTVLTIFS